MRPPLVRFGVAIDAPLLAELDKLVSDRGCTRSEMFRDLARAAVVRAKVRSGVQAVAALTIVYDHHVRDLSEKLTELQHQLGDGVRSAMHVHLNHDYCLEVIVIRGQSDELQAVADKILAMRGVKHGGIEIVANVELGHTDSAAPARTPVRSNMHAHAHPDDPAHTHAHPHSHVHERPSRARTTPQAAGRSSGTAATNGRGRGRPTPAPRKRPTR